MNDDEEIKKEKKSFLDKVKEKTEKILKKKEKVEEVKEETKEEPVKEEEPKKDEEPKEGGLRSEIKELKEAIQIASIKKKPKKDKTFNLPRKVKGQLKKTLTKDKILVFHLKTNRTIQPIIKNIENGMILLDGVPRNCSVDFIFLWKKKFPAIVMPEWDINPIGTEDYYKAVKAGRAADPIATVIRLIKEGGIIGKGLHLGSKAWIWIGLAAIAFFYVLFAGS